MLDPSRTAVASSRGSGRPMLRSPMSQNPSPDAPQQPKFDAAAPHMTRPKLRPVRAFPAQAKGPDGKEFQMMGLADARQISDQVVMVVPAMQLVLPLMDGSKDIDQICAQVGRGLTRPMLEGIVAQLDEAGLIEGPRFQAMLVKVREQFDSSEVLPPASTAQFADAIVADGVQKSEITEDAPQADKDAYAAKRLREIMDLWIAEALKSAQDPALDKLPKAIVAPHLDYHRGWVNYAAVYGRMRVVDRPDRVVVLGTNHFGESTGVCACDKGFSTVLGACEVDQDMLAAMRKSLGDNLFKHRYDHEREHSIELHMPWIQHVFGAGPDGKFPKVFGVLVHDPAVKNGESYDGNGVALEPFVDALKSAIASLPGRTLVVSSADLSHTGPAFGDQQTLAGDEQPAAEFRNKIFSHDREMINLVLQNKPSELVAAMAWQQNPTRWCSTGNLVATMMATQPSEIRLLNYTAAMDQQGMAMVASAAMVMN